MWLLVFHGVGNTKGAPKTHCGHAGNRDLLELRAGNNDITGTIPIDIGGIRGEKQLYYLNQLLFCAGSKRIKKDKK